MGAGDKFAAGYGQQLILRFVMLTFPHAKINIGLQIVGKRPDGYHNLQTIFVPIPLYDALEVIPYQKEMVWNDGGTCPDCPAKQNLVWKAFELLQQTVGALPPTHFYLRKKIPTGAGLGGGSSNAASALCMLSEVYNLGLTTKELQQLALTLGADCPFFVDPRPSYATGIGEVLTPITLDLTGLCLTLVLPPVHVSTAEAYRNVRPQTPTTNLPEAVKQPLEHWHETITNDFERSVIAQYPLIGTLKQVLYNAGATFAQMSGSGSSLFALSQQPLDLKGIPQALGARVYSYEL